MRLREEDSAPEIYAALSVLVRSGLIHCNTYDAPSKTLMLGAATTFTAGKALTAYLWREDVLNGPA